MKCPKCQSSMILDDRTTLPPSEQKDDRECGIPEKQMVCPKCWTYEYIDEDKTFDIPKCERCGRDMYYQTSWYCPECACFDIWDDYDDLYDMRYYGDFD